MTKYFEFSCGCKFPIISENPLRIKTSLDIHSTPIDCIRTWTLIGDGNTTGCFQLESQLAQTYCKKIKPTSIRELSDIISIIRPGCLDAKIKNKSVTNHYVDRKNGDEEIEYVHLSLEPILRNTYGLLIYQEQALKIAQEIAGFSPSKSEELRKGIGKKLPEVINKLRQEFINGCEQTGIVDKDIATQLFDNIEASQRYSFNASVLPTTLVTNELGEIKTIEELIIGEKILVPSDNNDKYAEVLNKFDHGEHDVFEITLESGKQICCTAMHKFLCENGEILPLWQILQENLKIVCEDD